MNAINDSVESLISGQSNWNPLNVKRTVCTTDLIRRSTRTARFSHLNQSPVVENAKQIRFCFGYTSGVVSGHDRGEKYLKHKHMVQKELNYKIFKASYDVHVNMTHILEPIRCISFRVTD